MNIGEGMSGAVFNNSARRFRYALWRFWWPDGDKLLFIGLNPSTANEFRNDPTIRRMIGFAKLWGFSGLFVDNLFSLVTPDPAKLWSSSSIKQPNGPNDIAIKRMRELSAKVMVGWGNFGARAGTRPEEVLAILGDPVFCLAKTHTGEPGHPLYLHSMLELQTYCR